APLKPFVPGVGPLAATALSPPRSRGGSIEASSFDGLAIESRASPPRSRGGSIEARAASARAASVAASPPRSRGGSIEAGSGKLLGSAGAALRRVHAAAPLKHAVGFSPSASFAVALRRVHAAAPLKRPL